MDILSSVDNFFNSLFFTNPYFIRYCELFSTTVLILLSTSPSCRNSHIYNTYNIYSTFVIINISLMQTNRKQCLHSFTEVIIFYIYNKCQCAFSIFAHLLYYKYLFLSMDLSDYSYLIISSIISDFVILSKTSVASRLDFSVLEI